MNVALSKILTVVLTRALGLLLPAAATVRGFISFDQFTKTVAKYFAFASSAGGLVGFLTYMATNSGAYTTSSAAAIVVATLIGALVELVRKFKSGDDPSNPPSPSPAPSPDTPGAAPRFLSTFEPGEPLPPPPALPFCPPGQCRFGKPLRECPDQPSFTGVLVEPSAS